MRATFEPTFPPPATIANTRPPASRLAHALGERLVSRSSSGRRRRARGARRSRARRVEQAHDDGRTSNMRFAICATTMFVLSPSVATTTASASSIPASRSTVEVHPVADDEAAAPVSPSRASAASVSSTAVTSQPSSAERPGHGRADPPAADDDRSFTLPPAVRAVLLEHALGVGDHHHLARRLPQHVVDRGAEEPRLPSPARRGADQDEVGAAPPPRRRWPRRSTARGRSRASTSTPCSAASSCASASDLRCALLLDRELRVERLVERHRDHVQRRDRRAAAPRRA